jgi:hypothetical protein
MKPQPSTLPIAGLSLLLCGILATSCTVTPPVEAEWNSLKIWHRVADSPPTYVQAGYGAHQPRTDRDGTWFLDKRDGKRVFVPDEDVGQWTSGVLDGEAKKVTGYVYKEPITKEDIAGDLMLALIYIGAAMGSGGAGYAGGCH